MWFSICIERELVELTNKLGCSIYYLFSIKLSKILVFKILKKNSYHNFQEIYK